MGRNVVGTLRTLPSTGYESVRMVPKTIQGTVSAPCTSNKTRIGQSLRCRVSGATGANIEAS